MNSSTQMEKQNLLTTTEGQSFQFSHVSIPTDLILLVFTCRNPTCNPHRLPLEFLQMWSQEGSLLITVQKAYIY